MIGARLSDVSNEGGVSGGEIGDDSLRYNCFHFLPTFLEQSSRSADDFHILIKKGKVTDRVRDDVKHRCYNTANLNGIGPD